MKQKAEEMYTKFQKKEAREVADAKIREADELIQFFRSEILRLKNIMRATNTGIHDRGSRQNLANSDPSPGSMPALISNAAQGGQGFTEGNGTGSSSNNLNRRSSLGEPSTHHIPCIGLTLCPKTCRERELACPLKRSPRK